MCRLGRKLWIVQLADRDCNSSKRWNSQWQRVRPIVSKGGTKKKQWQRLRLLQRVEMVANDCKWLGMVRNEWEWLEMDKK